MRYNSQSSYGYGSSAVGVWWYMSVLFGGFFALGSHGFGAAGRNLLYVLLALVCLAAPVVGVLITRAVTKHLAAKKRKPKLRGPLYADYAYIL